jgi:hypothetical protein
VRFFKGHCAVSSIFGEEGEGELAKGLPDAKYFVETAIALAELLYANFSAEYDVKEVLSLA